MDANWLIAKMARDLLGDAPLPGIVIQANPDPGITGIPTWFWVDPNSYGGQRMTVIAQFAAPWTLFWDVLIHHRDAISGPCPGDPSQQCVVGFNDWDEREQHQEAHVDVVNVSVELSPAQFAWDFGDDQEARRSESHATFPGFAPLADGLGQAFTDLYHPSPVVHDYRESSKSVFDHGGFPIQLTATWSATGTWHFTSDLGDDRSGSVTLDPRVGHYTMRHQVRESQPVLVSSPSLGAP